MATTFAYDGGTRYAIPDIKAYVAGTRKDVEIGYAYVNGKRELVYSRRGSSMTATSNRWDTVTLNWNAPSFPVSKYVLKRGTTQIYSGPNLTFTDTYPGGALMPSTSYTYNLEVFYNDGTTQVIESTAQRSQTTLAHPDLALGASVAAYHQINLNWAARVGSVDTFNLYRNGAHIYSGTGTSHPDGGLAASTTYNYELRAVRGGTTIRTDTTSATTSARPTSTGRIVTSGSNLYTWKQSSAPVDVFNSVSTGKGTAYAYSMKLQVAGKGATTYGSPVIGGHVLTQTDFGNATYGTNAIWSKELIGRGVGDATYGFGSPANIGIRRNTGYPTQWRYVTSGNESTIHFDIYYWWYSALGEKDVHVERWVDEAGEIIAERVYEKESGDLISETGEIPHNEDQ